ncbi:GmrSD restriction endonuclease domain-containing protein [Carbonactinospora thermoautotrophica]|uniref:GmrSD restriction endonuclease domain-containing protein n=1 Tax=Carbonactinospora thermoautotrophica TaxID=1469144 RepID=UPI003DA7C517
MAADVMFQSDKINLVELLQRVGSGAIQLPDFQRDWVWDEERLISLLASVTLSFPIGTLMTLETGNPDVRFAYRPLAGVRIDKSVEPEELLLDGQQRLTTLYQMLGTDGPVRTRDVRGRQIDRRYYLDIPKALDRGVDREEAIVAVNADRTVRQLHRVHLDLTTREQEYKHELLPVRLLLAGKARKEWMRGYVDGDQERWDRWDEFETTIVEALTKYQIPVIKMRKATPREAVCQVFEKVNTGGVSLNVFELVTAMYAADEFDLREDWEARRIRLRCNPVLEGVENTDFLQAISLLATQDVRTEWEQRRASGQLALEEAERPPAISCKRRDVLRLSLDEYRRYAEQVTLAFLEAGKFLHFGQGIPSNEWLPYRTQLVPLAAVLVRLGEKWADPQVREKIARWYWCGVFGELYGSSTETRFARDLPEVLGWVHGGPVPSTVEEANFRPARLYTMRTRNSAAYRGLYSLLLRDGAADLVTGKPIEITTYFEDAVDVRHVFPRAWCEKNGVDSGHMDCIVNKTPLPAMTSREIGSRAPSEYLSRLETQFGVDSGELNAALGTHAIDAGALRANDFDAFFAARKEQLLRRIETAMGKPITRETGDTGEGTGE